jgi:hypothetical protein
LCSWAITTPKAYPEASVSMMKGLFQSGAHSTGSLAHARFSSSNALCCSVSQRHW